MHIKLSSIAVIVMLGISLSVVPATAGPETTEMNSAQQSMRERAVDMLRIQITNKIFPNAKVELIGDNKSILSITSPSITPEMAKAFSVGTKVDTQKLLLKLGVDKMIISNGTDKWLYDLNDTDKLSQEESTFLKSVTMGTKESRQKMVNELFLGKIKKGAPDLQVSVLDSDYTIIKITSIDCSREAPPIMENCKGEFKKFGFRKFIFSDGKTEQSYDIN
jgi:hypothetical protein